MGNLEWKSLNPMRKVTLMKNYMRARDYEKLMGLLTEVTGYILQYVPYQTQKTVFDHIFKHQEES